MLYLCVVMQELVTILFHYIDPNPATPTYILITITELHILTTSGKSEFPISVKNYL